MRSIPLNIFIMAILFLSGYSQCFSAGANVEFLQGKVKTIYDKKSISVFLLDSDGSILDITGLDKQGSFQIDPTVMDEPLYKELTKLKIRITDKKNNKKEVNISNNIDEFSDNTLKLGNINFP